MGTVGPLEWMAWTTPTALFFIGVFMMLTVMGMVSVYKPSIPRQGFLPIATTRGDRLYIGLMICAFINLIWLALTDASQWIAVALSVGCMILVLRQG